jgi:hypothetical protein
MRALPCWQSTSAESRLNTHAQLLTRADCMVFPGCSQQVKVPDRHV